MDEIKLTRVGRYIIAWDRSDAVMQTKVPDQSASEKLQHLIKLGKKLEKNTKEGK